MTFHRLINEGKERLYKAGQGEQAAMLYMVELCQNAHIDCIVRWTKRFLKKYKPIILKAFT